MPGEGCDLLHAGIFPHDYLVEGVSVRGNDFIYILRPHEVTNLRYKKCVDGTKV